MFLSETSIEVLSDLIANRLAIMSIGDQDDLREKMALKRALIELQNNGQIPLQSSSEFRDIPRRGRRRKIAASGTL
ncbi:MAG: hypothetical protein PHW76_06065 [Alphaproteobacteria bacterium]|nr:hypothetical protein [Alphaproteobacteria bacterium]